MMRSAIAVLLHEPTVRARVSGAVARDFTVQPASSLGELLTLLGNNRVDVVVIDAADRDGRSHAASVAAIRRAFPTMPVLAWCSLSSASSAAILDLAKSGVTGLLMQGVDDAGHAIRVAVRSAQRGAVTRRVFSEIAPHMSPRLQPLLLYAISRTEDPSVEDAAHSLGVDRKTLGNWMRAHGDLSPREFINWIRVAIGVGLLEDSGRSAEQIALELGFASGTAFRNMLRRYTGVTTSGARARDRLTDVLETLSARLRSRDDAPRLEVLRGA
jgi:AraC-like DNA-binding protein